MDSTETVLKDPVNRHVPGLREWYYIFGSGLLTTPENRRQEFDKLDQRLAQKKRALLHHGVGWYLYWLLYTHSYDVQVLVQWGRIFSDKTIDKFMVSLPQYPLRTFRTLQAEPRSARRIDTPELIRFDMYTRAGNKEAADELYEELASGILKQYLGLPFVRQILAEETEDFLWTRVVSLSASCTRR